MGVYLCRDCGSTWVARGVDLEGCPMCHGTIIVDLSCCPEEEWDETEGAGDERTDV